MSEIRVVRVPGRPVRVVRVFAGPQGPAGMRWRGSWSSAATYVALDGVSDGGASYICTGAVGPTATTPDADPAHWDVLAAKGDPGAKGDKGDPGLKGDPGAKGDKGDPGIDGTGTMNGPASAVDGHLAVWDGTDGTKVRDGGAPLALGTTSSTAMAGDTAIPSAPSDIGAVATSSGITVVNHGSTAGTTRPAGAAIVYWIGTVEPANAAAGDLGYGWGAS